MNKQEFISKLRWFAENKGAGLPDEYGHPDYAPSRGETLLAYLLARYLDDPGIPGESPGINWLVDLPRHLVEAYAEFSTARRWSDARLAYKHQTGHDIPDLVDAHKGGLHRLLVAHSVARLMQLLAGECGGWLKSRIESTCEAQNEVIDHAWRQFIRVAYRKIMPRIKKERHRGNTGTFGTTDLLTYVMAGRVMFTFRRGGDSGPYMTYVADDSDMYGSRSGPNSPGAPYAECVAMIEDVIAHWDADKLVCSDSVRIAGM